MTKFATLTIENGVLILQNEISVELSDIPSSDPLAFMTGVQRGQYHVEVCSKNRNARVDHNAKFSELTPEYIRGFLFGFRQILVPEGTKIRKGQEQTLALLHLNTYKNL